MKIPKYLGVVLLFIGLILIIIGQYVLYHPEGPSDPNVGWVLWLGWAGILLGVIFDFQNIYDGVKGIAGWLGKK